MNASAAPSFAALQERASLLAGLTLSELASTLGTELPVSATYGKGWIGHHVEKFLGTTAGNDAKPDFPELGIEVKTLPISRQGYPKESTYVTVVPLESIGHSQWQNSVVKEKLNHVLWVPIEAEHPDGYGPRQFGTPFFWQMDEKTEAIIRNDWEEFAELICMGQIDRISAHMGTYLQIRPKAANNKIKTQAIGESGQSIYTLPRGFYLRTCATKEIVASCTLI